MYYLRTRAAADAIKFTVDQQALAKNRAAKAAKIATALPVSALPTGLKVSSLQSIFVDSKATHVGNVHQIWRPDQNDKYPYCQWKGSCGQNGVVLCILFGVPQPG